MNGPLQILRHIIRVSVGGSSMFSKFLFYFTRTLCDCEAINLYFSKPHSCTRIRWKTEFYSNSLNVCDFKNMQRFMMIVGYGIVNITYIAGDNLVSSSRCSGARHGDGDRVGSSILIPPSLLPLIALIAWWFKSSDGRIVDISCIKIKQNFIV